MPQRILVVDDEPTMAEILGLCLADLGCVVESAPDGLKGLNQFYGRGWDAVVIDRCMPGINGCELALAIRAIAPNLPIIMVSGLPELIEQDEACVRTIDAVVRKPFTVEQIRTAILHSFEKRLRRRE